MDGLGAAEVDGRETGRVVVRSLRLVSVYQSG